MTIKVVRKPDREVACSNCKCVLSYQMEDTQIGSRGANYGGDTPEPARYIKCPECDSTVWVEERP